MATDQDGDARATEAGASSIILACARHIMLCRERLNRLEAEEAELRHRRGRGEDVFPALPHTEAAGRAAYDAEIAAGDVILTTAPETDGEALIQLSVATARLDWIAACVPTDETPELAGKIERAMLASLAVLRRRAEPEATRFLDDYAGLQRDVLHHEPAAVAEAAD